ncbi:hypothetical protein V8C86DRAFT_844420 [Haematococcus lacustris]
MGASTRCPASLQHRGSNKLWQSWGKVSYTSISTFGFAHNSARILTSCSSYTSRTYAMRQACLPFQSHQLLLAWQLPGMVLSNSHGTTTLRGHNKGLSDEHKNSEQHAPSTLPGQSALGYGPALPHCPLHSAKHSTVTPYSKPLPQPHHPPGALTATNIATAGMAQQVLSRWRRSNVVNEETLRHALHGFNPWIELWLALVDSNPKHYRSSLHAVNHTGRAGGNAPPSAEYDAEGAAG